MEEVFNKNYVHKKYIFFRFIVMNLDKRRVFATTHPHGEEGDNKQMTTSRKLDTLRTFIRNTVGPIFPDIYVPNPYSIDSNTGGEYFLVISIYAKAISYNRL